MDNKTFFLIGFMTAGKSSLAKKLASSFGYNFIDLDIEIEKAEGKTINEIFEENGEDYFRKKESEILQVLDLSKAFVAAGGGTPCFNDNIKFMKNTGVVIYLKNPAEIIVGRLRQNKESRPLVKNLSDNQLQEFVVQTLYERKDFYEQADITIPNYKSFSRIKMEIGLIVNEQ